MRGSQEKQQYVSKILDFYLRLPETPFRFSRTDVELTRQLYEDKVRQEDIELAMILASLRRAYPKNGPLGPIRSLHYFLPVLQEIRRESSPASYRQYLRTKFEKLMDQRKIP